jgi:hypothetical protein
MVYLEIGRSSDLGACYVNTGCSMRMVWITAEASGGRIRLRFQNNGKISRN